MHLVNTSMEIHHASEVRNKKLVNTFCTPDTTMAAATQSSFQEFPDLGIFYKCHIWNNSTVLIKQQSNEINTIFITALQSTLRRERNQPKKSGPRSEFQSIAQTVLWLSKTISVKVIDDEEYEKNKTFFLEIGEPRLVEMSEKKALLLNELGGFTITVEKTESERNTLSKYRQQAYGRVCAECESYDSQNVYKRPDEYDDKQPLTSKEEEERRIAEMGRPILGEHTRLEVIIEESYEFKSTVDKLIKKTNLALVVGTNSWREQFIEAITVSAGEDDDDDECGEEKLPSCFDYVMHFLTVFWKVLFAFVPPTEYWNGWACFIVSILMIGILTAFIGDLASHFGCTIGLKDSVTAVVFVALGTSVPEYSAKESEFRFLYTERLFDRTYCSPLEGVKGVCAFELQNKDLMYNSNTFASKVAATQDQYADASIGNVTGSNAVNVFLGIGVAWSIAAIYHAANGEQFKVSPGTLAFSVTLFTIFAFINVGVLLYRRRPEIGGELGGPRTAKLLTSCLFVLLWLLYIFFSSLEAYCHIKGF
ncbi:hypothetical protein MJG53_004947 [Ovis ammon polii x Ovis aries]|uniref:Uncharacterized protein n=1 Tax=Ovis ammon polii x Ovis aries TaxID=2918886 RepID=A0ACB9VCH5_9CETA|nr:hypothetical protein MJT46_002976 [Ovis ammon polii x Ovis aries]KAI4587160.1 hypothetical protein MJG53_004947 [Ovis ammon polii x Ovis aries]